jgi:FKBP-type peptidyl-prolyl cis-trans isomerase FklB
MSLLQKQKELGAAFMAQKATEPGYYKLPSGLLIKSLKKGHGETSPLPRTPCAVHYTGTLINGTKFDSSRDRGAPTSFAPNQVIPGWTEALQLMREGDHWEIIIPSELAYGDRGAGGAIPGGATLVFEMEVMNLLAPGRPAADTDKELLTKIGKTGADM